MVGGVAASLCTRQAMIELLAAFLCGSLLTAVLIAAGVLCWLYAQSRPKKIDDESEEKPYICPQLPQVLRLLLCGDPVLVECGYLSLG